MKRRLTKLLSWALCVLLGGELFLWIGSQWLDGDVVIQKGPTSYVLQSVSGVILIGHAELGSGFTMNIPQGWNWGFDWQDMFSHMFLPDNPTLWNRIGFGLLDDPIVNSRFVMLPHWALALCVLLPWFVVFTKIWTQHRRRRFGLCVGCGYDLRASEGKCPECGLAIPADLVRKPIA